MFSELFSTAKLISTDTVSPALKAIVPTWLHYISAKIIESAKVYAPRFGSASRKFGYVVTGGFGSTDAFRSTIWCNGPFVETTAFDYKISVPPGGFKYGDIDPLTKEPFPGGISKYGSYIELVDKPEAEGEKVKAVSRTYSKHSGKTIQRAGFFSQSIRKNIGYGVILSEVGKNDLQLLALFVGKEIARNIGEQIRIEGIAKGLSVTVDGPTVVTMEF